MTVSLAMGANALKFLIEFNVPARRGDPRQFSFDAVLPRRHLEVGKSSPRGARYFRFAVALAIDIVERAFFGRARFCNRGCTYSSAYGANFRSIARISAAGSHPAPRPCESRR